jgi:Fe-S-cluster containining protein
MKNGYDCQSCGACCQYPLRVSLIGKDVARVIATGMGEELIFDPHIYSDLRMKTKILNGHRVCAAFEGRIANKCSCSIYDKRPHACRAFRPGNWLCKRERKRVGLSKKSNLQMIHDRNER